MALLLSNQISACWRKRPWTGLRHFAGARLETIWKPTKNLSEQTTKGPRFWANKGI